MCVDIIHFFVVPHSIPWCEYTIIYLAVGLSIIISLFPVFFSFSISNCVLNTLESILWHKNYFNVHEWYQGCWVIGSEYVQLCLVKPLFSKVVVSHTPSLVGWAFPLFYGLTNACFLHTLINAHLNIVIECTTLPPKALWSQELWQPDFRRNANCLPWSGPDGGHAGSLGARMVTVRPS